MTSTISPHRSRDNGRAASPGAPLMAPARQRSAPLIVLGVLFCFVGALTFGALNLRMSDGRDVLVIARAVGAGHIVQSGDLRVSRLAGDAGVSAVPATDRSSVVGRTAAVDLAAGSLLVRSQLGARSALSAGSAVVGLALKPGQMPAALQAGDRVLIVDTTGASPGTEAAAPSAPRSGSVLAVTPADDAAGLTNVSVVVAESDAAAVAVAGAANHISLVLLPPAP